MTRSDASLKGKIKSMAKKSNLKPQELLQMYLFEHLLMRLEKSDYAETFVLRGAPIFSMTGITQRTTTDMDATAVGMDMGEGTVSAAISSICPVSVGDGMEYSSSTLSRSVQTTSTPTGEPICAQGMARSTRRLRSTSRRETRSSRGASNTAIPSCSRRVRCRFSPTR